ncbi:hypothetical protein PUN71_021695 [Arthrobacter sp. NQ7]|uniref:hypothetical protein n=1 Tax=Arthrobacter sp. NQ7 TaxID=3032303 RepID=UPI00241008CD|nr:hypothetical protein [Arthrobacter sp. NQ7]MDJ0459826.1 hypothetical protein [Arthrobacter sp. NQ7]
MVVLPWDETPVLRNREEKELLTPLLNMMRSRGWINENSLVLSEMPLNGRRADLATLTKSGIASAYEMKMGSFHRVLEQAMYNRLSFDRSWIVVNHRPTPKNLEQARENGIGVIVLDDKMSILLWASRQPVSPVIRAKIRAIFRRGTRG